MLDFRWASIATDGKGGFETTTGFGWLIVPGIIILAVILFGYILSFFIKVYWNSRKVALEWQQFEQLMEKIQLTHEEANFIRTNLKKYGYINPLVVLRKEIEFDRFSKKILRRRNHHYEFLLQMVKKKAFTGHKHVKSNSATQEKIQTDIAKSVEQH